jgi:uncharacterized protein (TIGR02145 family)
MKTIQIGSQVWTRKNLRVFKFRNGDPIPIIQDSDEWALSQEAAMCINPYNGECYYNWHAVADKRGLAPKGFHVPSDMEWYTLIKVYDGFDVAAKLLKSPKKWDGAGVPKGFNVKGFDAIPSGYRTHNGDIITREYSGFWWTSTPCGSEAFCYYMFSGVSIAHRDSATFRNGFSVRLIKD